MGENYDYEYSESEGLMNMSDFQVLEAGKYQMIVENPLDMENLWR